MRSIIRKLTLGVLLMPMAFATAQANEKKTITGEVMDTWCYVSQIMGPSEFMLGTTHHVCAVWCAAGGIPVGILDSSDGTIYMVMGVGEDTTNVANEELLNLQSHELTVEGTTFELDGLNYIMIDNIVSDQGITKLTHEAVGILPAEARP
ncbi:MAG: hypothetical protein AAF402_10795 [Pseudomonadota bacterium]